MGTVCYALLFFDLLEPPMPRETQQTVMRHRGWGLWTRTVCYALLFFDLLEPPMPRETQRTVMRHRGWGLWTHVQCVMLCCFLICFCFRSMWATVLAQGVAVRSLRLVRIERILCGDIQLR